MAMCSAKDLLAKGSISIEDGKELLGTTSNHCLAHAQLGFRRYDASTVIFLRRPFTFKWVNTWKNSGT